VNTLDLVFDACVQSVMIETDRKVIVHLLRTIHTLKNKEIKNNSAVVILLKSYILKPITIKTVISELILDINQEFLLDIMNIDFQSILNLTPIEGFTGEGGEFVLLTDSNICNENNDYNNNNNNNINNNNKDNNNGSKTNNEDEDIKNYNNSNSRRGSLFVSTDLLKLILTTTFELVRTAMKSRIYKKNAHNGECDNTLICPPKITAIFMKCSIKILHNTSLKDSKKHLLCLLSTFLCNLTDCMGNSAEHSLSKEPSLTRELFLDPFLLVLTPEEALNFLILAGGGPGGDLEPSGFSIECLKVIIESIDDNLRDKVDNDVIHNEKWNLLVKKFNAKKIEKIQCELQPLVLYLINRPNTDKSYTDKADGDWGLRSIVLCNLFTLDELKVEIYIYIYIYIYICIYNCIYTYIYINTYLHKVSINA
jgi:hypothetical protein